MTRSFRSSLLPFGVVLYVSFAAVQASGGAVHSYFALLALPLALAYGWQRTRTPEQTEDPDARAARLAVRACVWGSVLWVAARTGPSGRPGFEAAANLGAGTVAVAGLIALARIPSPGGLLGAHPAARSLDAAAFSGFAWAIAAALPATRALLPSRVVRLDPLTIDYATTTASVASLLVLLTASLRLRALRRFELGVGDRASGALALALASFLFVVPAAVLLVAPPDRLLPLGVLLASAAATWAASARDPASIARGLRAALAIAMLGAPTVLVAGLLARELPMHAGTILLLASTLAILVGLLARSLARPLGPEQSRWLDAIEGATQAALVPEPDAALRAALEELGKAMSRVDAVPALYRNDPEEALSVDIAGYLHTEAGSAPERLYELALGEPERTLRAEVLKAVEVRRPEVRPLLAWFDDRHAFSATLVVAEEGPIGFLLVPRGARTTPMTLEEARAFRVLCDRLSAVLAMSSALARSQQRELALRASIEAQQQEIGRLGAIVALGDERHRLSAERLASRIRRAAYSPAARFTLEAIERAGARAPRLALEAPPGVDVASWAAVAHLSSGRAGGPLVVVDGSSGAERDLERWRDGERSPLALAEGGTLALLHVLALPLEVQEEISLGLARRTQRAADSTVPAPGLVLGLHDAPARLVETGRLARALERTVAPEAIKLPRLADRAEDLRALVLDELARLGMRLTGEPLGIEPAALRLLSEHEWPGNELELEHVLARACACADGPVLTADALRASGFEVDFAPEPALTTPIPLPARSRRPPARPRY